MGLFNRKEKVPEIPPAPSLPEIPSTPFSQNEFNERYVLPELPSFPINPRTENMNQQMVKSAVADDHTPEDNEVLVDMPSEDGLHKESIIPLPPKSRIEMPPIVETEEIKKRNPSEPIFVRIDKFQEAQKDFKQIKLKVKEIESILRKVKSVKEKEKEEIEAWTMDLENIKLRLSEIDSNIFSQI